MGLQRTNPLGFPSHRDEQALKEYPGVQGTLLDPLVRVPDVLLAGSPGLKALKQAMVADRERKVIESLPDVFKRKGWPTGANMMHYWLHGRSIDGKRTWDYQRSNTKGVLLRDAEVCRLIGGFERFKNAVKRLHRKVAEPENIIQGFTSIYGFGFALSDLEKSRAKLYARFSALAPGAKESIQWGEKVEYPDHYLEMEEVGILKMPLADDNFNPVYYDDLSVGFGRFGIRAYASGELVKKEDKTGYFSVSAIGFRIFDHFSFQVKSLPLLSQFLGSWSENGPESLISPKGIYLNDASFVNYKKRYQKGTDFIVYSKIYTFNEISALCKGLNLASPPSFTIPLSVND